MLHVRRNHVSVSAKMITNETLEGVPLLLLANKQDLQVKCNMYLIITQVRFS